MLLDLRRRAPTGDAIISDLEVNGEYECLVLERGGVQIPPGRFLVTLWMSPKFRRLVPRLHDVPGREDIEFHVGSYPRDTRGCLLTGTFEIPGGVGGSSWALTALVKLLDAPKARGENIWLTVHPSAVDTFRV